MDFICNQKKRMKNVLIINGHPDKNSFNYALSNAYYEGASQTNANIEQVFIADLKFDINLAYGYKKRIELEPDLLDAIEKIKKANHIVWVFPMWWYSLPAQMKGFIDRVFLPGIAFKFKKGSPFPEQLFKGKTARVIVTADTPSWYNKLWMRHPIRHQFNRGTLMFCGIKPVKMTYLAPVKNTPEKQLKKWLDKVEALGRRLK